MIGTGTSDSADSEAPEPREVGPEGADGEREAVRGLAWLILVPVLIGIFFESRTASHGDWIQYWLFPTGWIEDGWLPLQPWETAHFSHYASVAGVLQLGHALGIPLDATWITRLLEFVLHGLLAFSVARLVPRLCPSLGRTGAITIGLLLGTMPGWAWCSQMGMSDVSGNAMALLLMTIFAHLEISSPRETRSPARALGAYLALGAGLSWMLMWRISTAAFAPLFVWLFVRLLVATPGNGQRVQRTLLLLIGFVIPPLLYAWALTSTYDWQHIDNELLRSSGDNSQFTAGLFELLPRWWKNLVQAHGLLIWPASIALLGLLVISFRTGGLRAIRSRDWLFPGLVLGLLPYLVAVARNLAWFEFRYLVPIHFALTLALGVLLAWSRRFLGARGALALGLAAVLLQLSHAGPMLSLFKSREAHGHASVTEQLSMASKRDMLISHYNQSLQTFLGEDRWILPIENVDSEQPRLKTYVARNWAAELMLVAHSEGRRILMADEILMRGQAAWFLEQGWTRKLLREKSGATLRNFEDPYHVDMDAEKAARIHDLKIWQWIPPDDSNPRMQHRLSWTPDSKELVIEVEAGPFANRPFCVLFGTRSGGANRVPWRSLWLPFHPDDPAVSASLELNVERAADRGDRVRLSGTLDGEGRARITLPPALAVHALGLHSTALFPPSIAAWREARFRTAARVTPNPQ